ncbi:hypothetical protein R3W88_007856 [Solanum pinnatisectum]|uniref:F-box domain-containing protein n=1 Tax=Solanum pinnatisectum TaxID=50273 RepID=A0AAV9M9P6_9SOLN|nr:hypothetical protein R3W88_007856 [Solanum pinnatisectum]
MSIPQDITIQIFLCLPAKSLMRFKCVSKFYNTIVLEPYFVEIRSSNYSKINRVIECLGGVFYFVEIRSSNYSKINRVIECLGGVFYSIEEDGNATKSYQLDNFDKLCHHFDRVSNCFGYDNGLFCTWDEKYISIFNPAIGEVRYLPHLKCYDGSLKKTSIKILLTIYKRSHLELSRAWVFTLGIDNSWREIITYGEHDYYIFDLGYGDCVISGIIYRFSDSPEFCVVAFDIKSEFFTTITRRLNFTIDYMLIDVNGKLGIMYIPEVFLTKDIHLWILKEEWEHQIFEFPLEWKHEDDIKLDPFCICKYGDEEIVFALWIKSIDNKSWRYFKAEEYAGVKSIFSYSESLFPLKNIGLPTTIAEERRMLV